jgi:hypothetical protein
MNAVEVGAWNANWAWSLPLIVLNVVIHVIGLGLINESVVRVLSGQRISGMGMFTKRYKLWKIVGPQDLEVALGLEESGQEQPKDSDRELG